MDILFFLRRRTEFIRGFYDAASEPFRERIRKIEAGEEPFAPPYSEDGDPPYELEWNEAVTSKEILGRSCISMLSAALQLYFKTWEDHLRIQWAEGEKKATFKNGFVQGLQSRFWSSATIRLVRMPGKLRHTGANRSRSKRRSTFS